jgi:IMP cyclohydrolase
MYIGRIVSIAMTEDGRICAGYRVSSRSFPNRMAIIHSDAVSIVPQPGHEADVQKNPYIAYHCIRLVCRGAVAVVTNGSQTDPIAEKIASGMPCRDAMILSMLTLDYEKDQYNTPRICAVADAREGGAGWLGVIREDGLETRRMQLAPGRFFYVATYEENRISETQGGRFEADTAAQACEALFTGDVFRDRTNAVTAAAAMVHGGRFQLAVKEAGAA